MTILLNSLSWYLTDTCSYSAARLREVECKQWLGRVLFMFSCSHTPPVFFVDSTTGLVLRLRDVRVCNVDLIPRLGWTPPGFKVPVFVSHILTKWPLWNELWGLFAKVPQFHYTAFDLHVNNLQTVKERRGKLPVGFGVVLSLRREESSQSQEAVRDRESGRQSLTILYFGRSVSHISLWLTDFCLALAGFTACQCTPSFTVHPTTLQTHPPFSLSYSSTLTS